MIAYYEIEMHSFSSQLYKMFTFKILNFQQISFIKSKHLDSLGFGYFSFCCITGNQFKSSLLNRNVPGCYLLVLRY